MRKILLSMCLVAGAALLAGCLGGEDQANNNKQAEEEKASQSQSQNQQKEQTKKTTLQSLAKKGENMVCDYEMPEEDNLKGTVYVADSGEKIRTENTSSGDLEYANAIINLDEDMMYSWTKTRQTNEVMGMKMKMSSLDEYSEKTASAQSGDGDDQAETNPGFQPDEKIEYDCKNWKVDDSKFNPPSDVQFMDLDEFMENLPQDMPSSPEDMPEMPEDMPEAIPTY